ncbi:MAG TPA: acyl-CoA thioesterase [Candidatus Agrococcus pullicola]|uniref:Acyl-CoA thioesterase n=1 Tax=Candidatus Agrococcus pullicola TaxID=2838429 RepID=A0A9D2C9Y9_9MICO|nr:acyl-CoA thioesterase [Candidatus Agrococcus pullicola]
MYVTQIEPRISETDVVGHINNTVPPVWFEAGRNELFRVFMSDGTLDDWPMIVKAYSVVFERELRYGSVASVECGVERIGTTSVTLDERILQDGEICVTGKTTYVHVGPDGRPAPVPAEIRAELERHLPAEEKR